MPSVQFIPYDSFDPNDPTIVEFKYGKCPSMGQCASSFEELEPPATLPSRVDGLSTDWTSSGKSTFTRKATVTQLPTDVDVIQVSRNDAGGVLNSSLEFGNFFAGECRYNSDTPFIVDFARIPEGDKRSNVDGSMTYKIGEIEYLVNEESGFTDRDYNVGWVINGQPLFGCLRTPVN